MLMKLFILKEGALALIQDSTEILIQRKLVKRRRGIQDTDHPSKHTEQRSPPE